MHFASTRREFLSRAALFTGASTMFHSLAAGAERPSGAAPASAGDAAGQAVPLAPPDKQPAKLYVPDVPAKKVGWAIVGLGQLSVEQILPAFGEAKLANLVALVSGHPEKAQKLAALHGVASDAIYSYETYDKLANDPRVDVIYIVLPNSMHAEYTVRGFKAGKHVFCEKPMSVQVAEAEGMIAAGKQAGKQLGIAYRLHYEPLNLKASELCLSKQFGPVKIFSSANGQDTPAPNIRLSKDLGGGPVGDVGVYSINAARYCIGEEPTEVYAIAHQPKEVARFREVPETVTYIMRYPSGAVAHCDCSFGVTESRYFRATCEKGFVEMDPAFSYKGLKLAVKTGDAAKGTEERKVLGIPQVNHFAAEMDDFSKCILENKPTKTPGELGLADMRIVDAIYESLRTGAPVKI